MKRIVPAVGLAVLLCHPAAAFAADILSCTFEPGPPTFSGNWSNSLSWGGSCGAGIVPNNTGGTHYFATVSPAFGANQVFVDMNVTLDKLAIDDPNNDDGVRVDVNNNHSLTLENSGLADSGVSNISGALHLNSIGNDTSLIISGNNFFGGNDNTGLIELSNNALNRIRGDGGGDDTLTLEFVDIRGAGQLGTDNLTISTNGVVEANKSAGLVVDPDDAGGYTNNGLLQASNGATLTLQDGTFTNVGHQIKALDASTVSLAGATILGGVLDTDGSGRFVVTSASTLDGIGLINTGVIDVPNNSTLHLLGAISNQGTINLLSIGNTTDLSLRDDVTLDGGGTVNLSNNVLNRIRSDTGTGNFTLTNEDNTIRGSGRLGDNVTGFVNRGTVRADQAATLTIDPKDTETVVNAGTFEAVTGGELILAGGVFENFEGGTQGTITAIGATLDVSAATVTGGLLTLGDAAELQLNGGTVVGGTLTNSATGAIRTQSGVSRLGGLITNPLGGLVRLENNTTLELLGTGAGNAFTNDGTIRLASIGNVTDLVLLGDLTLLGTGEVVLSGSTVNRVYSSSGTARLTSLAQTVHGYGSFGKDQMSFTTGGLVDADVLNQVLTLDPADSGDVTNTSTLQASNGGTLLLLDGLFNNAGGLIQALDGSMVQLNGATVTGGVLDTDGSGHIDVTAASTLDGIGIVNQGTLNVLNNTALYLIGALTNAGVINMLSIGNTTDLLLRTDLMLDGGGVVDLSNNALNRLRSDTVAGNFRLTNVDNVIRGAGRLGDNTLSFTNQHLVEASKSAGLTLDPWDGGDVVNQGTLRARNGATLTLQGGTFDNGAGLIEALDASTVSLAGATILGGVLDTDGSGRFVVTSASTLDGIGLINTGVIDVPNNSTLHLLGAISNQGTINLLSIGNTTDLSLRDDVTLDGGGTVNLSNNVLNRIRSDTGTGNFTLTNEDNTIRGSGRLGDNVTGFVNRGTVRADQAATLTIDPKDTETVVNAGTFEAVTGGELILAGGVFENFEGGTQGTITAIGATLDVSAATVTGGLLTLGDAAELQLNGGTVVGGTLTNSATGAIRTQSGVSRLGGLITNPLGGLVRLENNTTLELLGTGAGNAFTNDGTIRLASIGNVTDLVLLGDLTLLGTGEVVLSGSTVNRVYSSSGTARLTSLAQTVHGYGSFGKDQMSFTTGGLVDADVLNQVLTLDPADSGDVTNTSTLQASNGGTLLLLDGLFNNAGGLIQALDGSMVQLNGATVTGGVLDTDGSGHIDVTAASTLDGIGIVNQGTLNVLNNTALYLIGALTNAGVINMLSIGNTTDLLLRTDLMLDGGGVVDLSNNALNRLRSDTVAGNFRLTNVDNVIRGAGRLGDNTLSFTNQHLVEASKSAGLTLDPWDGGDVVNQGTLRARNGATLTLQGGTFDNGAGLIEALDASTVSLAGATILGGVLDTDGSGRFVVTSASTLDGIGLINTGVIDVPNNSTLHLLGAISNQGTINLLSIGNTTDLSLRDDVTLDGGGTVNLSNNVLNRIRSDTGTGNFTLTNEDNTIRGSGRLGDNVTGFVNRGTVRADQAATLTIDPKDDLGFSNEGTLEAVNGATLAIGAGNFDTSGSVQIAAGATLSRTGAYTQTGGLTHVDGTLGATGTVFVNGGLLQGNGTIAGDLDNAAQVGPGASIGTLKVLGTFAQPTTGEFLLELAALDDFDVIDITGAATLGGKVIVSLLGGYLPNIGDTFTFLFAGSVIDNFDSAVCPSCNGGAFAVVTGPDFAALTVLAAPVPLPPSFLALGSALAALTLIRVRQRS